MGTSFSIARAEEKSDAGAVLATAAGGLSRMIAKSAINPTRRNITGPAAEAIHGPVVGVTNLSSGA